ncbi:hypothetical protein D3C86_882570 [compost metagenome]
METGSTSRLKRDLQPMPPFVETALVAQGLMAAYQERPPYQRNDYLSWINRAKREETKLKRLAQMLAELTAGDRYMNMAWRPGSAAPGGHP